MEHLTKYSIPFVGLTAGVHHFNYEIDDTFFDKFENSVIKSGKITAGLDIDRQENMLLLHFHFAGYITVDCDLCLESFHLPIENNKTMIVKFGEVHEEQDEDIYVLARNESNINVAPHIYDYLSLSIPMKIEHPLDENNNSTCNPEAIKNIEKFITKTEKKKPNSDPRWDALKNLFKNDN